MQRLCTVLIALLVLSAGPTHAVTGGDPAPAFVLPDAKNTKVELAALRGKVVYVDFWASWCVPCRESFPWMNEMQRKYGQQGLQIVAINVDVQRKEADQFLSKYPAGFTVLFDTEGNIAKSYAVKVMPSAYLIDKDGRISARHLGFRDAKKAEVETQIKQLLGVK